MLNNPNFHFMQWLISLATNYRAFVLTFIAIYPFLFQLPNYKLIISNPFNILYYAPLIFLLILSYLSSKAYKTREKEYSEKLKDKDMIITELHDEIMNIELRHISNVLQFENSERISIYYYQKQEDNFICIARFSSHCEFNKRDVKKTYQKGTGIIGKVWRITNEYIEYNDIPNYEVQGKQKYAKHMKDTFGVHAKEINNFSMKSCNIIGYKVRALKNDMIGILIFESTKSQKLDSTKINNILIERMQNIVTNLDPLITFYEKARKTKLKPITEDATKELRPAINNKEIEVR